MGHRRSSSAPEQDEKPQRGQADARKVEAWARTAATGNAREAEVAFTALFERYAGPIHRRSLRAAEGDQHTAEDISQQTWLHVAENITSYQATGAGFPGWLFTIQRNIGRSRVRSSRLRLERLFPDEELLDLSVTDPGDGPEALAVRAERIKAIRAAILRLPRRQRHCLVLRHFDGLEWSDVAALLDLTENAARQLEQRALRRLGTELAGLLVADRADGRAGQSSEQGQVPRRREPASSEGST